MKILLSEDKIQERVKEIAKTIAHDYEEQLLISLSEPLYLLFILKGSFMFTADLVRELSNLGLKLFIDTIQIHSYRGTESGRIVVNINDVLRHNLTGKYVLIVDDILDTGKTLTTLNSYLKRSYKPKKLEYCCLLKKNHAREKAENMVKVKYVGFEIPDKFVIGYGLDFDGFYRELPYIAIYKREENKQS